MVVVDLAMSSAIGEIDVFHRKQAPHRCGPF
jgi:hypothetical protein